MKKVFIDCGANDGCSVRKFRTIISDHKEYEIHSFECNQKLAAEFSETDAKFYPQAVSDSNSEVTFYMHSKNNVAGTTYEKKGKMKNCGCNTPGYVTEHKIQSIKLSDFIKENFSKDDFIILKLDVEGEEYRIVPDMIESGAFQYVNELWIEWHSKWINENPQVDVMLEKKINSLGVKVDNTWDACNF